MVHVVGENAAPDPDGPQELVDVVAGVARHSPEDDEHIVNIQRLPDKKNGGEAGGVSSCLSIFKEKRANSTVGTPIELPLAGVSGGLC